MLFGRCTFSSIQVRRGALRYRARTIPAKGMGSKLAQTHDSVSVFLRGQSEGKPWSRGVGYLTRRRCPIRRVLLRSMPFSWQMRVMVVP